MKTIMFLIMSVMVVFGQPDFVGTVAGSNKMATLISPTHFVSSAHYHPNVGQTITFGSGEQKVVSSGKTVGDSLFDLWFGTFETPATTTPCKVWWHNPTEYLPVPGEPIVNNVPMTGYSFQGEYQCAGRISQFWGTYSGYGISFIVETPGFSVQSGYSGSPIFLDGALVGLVKTGGGGYGSGYSPFTVFGLFPEQVDFYTKPTLGLATEKGFGYANVPNDNPVFWESTDLQNWSIFEQINQPTVSPHTIVFKIEITGHQRFFKIQN